MKSRPRVLVWIAAALWIAASSIPIQLIIYSWLGGGAPLAPLELIEQMSGLAWALLVLALASGLLILKASRFGVLLSVVFAGALAWSHWELAQANSSLAQLAPSVIPLSVLLGTLLIHVPLLTPAIRRLLGNPKLRWWLTRPRYRSQAAAVIWPVLGGEIQAATFDLSEGGAFLIPRTSDETRAGRDRLAVGSRLSLRIRLDSDHVFHCQGEVVRRANARGLYPAGVGVRFLSVDGSDRALLKRYLSLQPAPELTRPGVNV